MTEKKISFGFKQVKKRPVLLPVKTVEDTEKKNDTELIQCLEGQTFKLIHEKEEKKPLVIPLLNSQKTSTALASLKNLKNVLNADEQNADETENVKSIKELTQDNGTSLTIEQRVIKELLNEANNADGENDSANSEKLSLPLVVEKVGVDGAKESTIDDYESIPIAQFGMAMLRGMGLKDEEILSKKNKEPELRPKGMGLGADKVIKKVKLLVAPAQNETLEIKKNAYVRILAGKNKNLYGQIEGLDDHACRVIVRLALGGARETLNEFMVQPVSKREFQQFGKVINSAKYEEYKRKQEKQDAETDLKKNIKKECSKSQSKSIEKNDYISRSQRESSPGRSKERSKQNETRSRQRYRSKERSRERSDERSKRSASCDRNRSGQVQRDIYKNRRSRSTERYNHNTSSSSRRDTDKYRKCRQRSKSSSKSSSSNDSQHKKRGSQHNKSKKKHKKNSSKTYDSLNDDDNYNQKKKPKKNKRERSRSRGRQ